MTTHEELQRINSELRKLRAEKKELEEIRKAKIENVKLKLENFVGKKKAEHPFVSALIGQGSRGLLRGGIAAGQGIATGLRAYLNYLDEQDRRRAENRRIAEATG